MIAIGCLAPFILGVAGGLGANAIAGPAMAVWGFGAGFALGGAILGALLWLMGRARS